MITLEVLGSPAPKGSSRAFMNRKTGRAMIAPSGSKVNQQKIASWTVSVRHAAQQAIASGALIFRECPLRVDIVFRLLRPRGHYSKATGNLLPSAPAFPATKPDIDKLARTTLDAMTGSIFDDDSRIASLRLDKAWAEPGSEGATIRVESMFIDTPETARRKAEVARKVGDLFAEATA